ncbi:MAG: TrgA family protein [Pseudomonadota bacterium]
MPTAAKLIGGILTAVLGYFLADAIVAYLPPETRIGRFREITTVLGFFAGWRFLGNRVGEGYVASLGFGIGAGAFMVLWMLIVFSGYEMTIQSMRKAYGGPVEALQGMVDIAISYFIYLKPLDVWGLLLAGSAAIGIVGEAVARRLP